MDTNDRAGGLMAWQWRTYPRNHVNRANLLVHMLAVPMFIAAALASVRLAIAGAWIPAGACLIVMAFAFLLQGVGHKLESEPPIPFRGPFDFLSRVFVEQFVTFPRFVLSGGWSRNMAGQSDA